MKAPLNNLCNRFFRSRPTGRGREENGKGGLKTSEKTLRKQRRDQGGGEEKSKKKVSRGSGGRNQGEKEDRTRGGTSTLSKQRQSEEG